jgi:hypothetical protein
MMMIDRDTREFIGVGEESASESIPTTSPFNFHIFGIRIQIMTAQPTFPHQTGIVSKDGPEALPATTVSPNWNKSGLADLHYDKMMLASPFSNDLDRAFPGNHSVSNQQRNSYNRR